MFGNKQELPLSRILALTSAAAVALSMLVTLPSFAYDHPHPQNDQNYDAGAGFVAGTLGFMAGAAAANGDGYDNGDYQPHHMRGGHWRHVQACQDAYGWRYDADTDMVRGRYHREFPCEL